MVCLLAKTKVYEGMPYEYFTKLYDTLVQPILDYGASIWGPKEFSCVNAVQNRTSHYYMGVGKYTLNGAIHGDMGWRLATPRQWITVTRQWCRMMNMVNTRINKRVLLWSLNKAN